MVDLGAVSTPGEVEDALDRGTTARLVTILGVEATLESLAARGRPGVGVLRAILDGRALGTARADGMLEPRFARLQRAQGIQPAVFQHEVRDRRGRFVARVDFAYPERRLAIEVSGFEVHGTPRAMTIDFERQAKLAAQGWLVLPFTWYDVVRRPDHVASTLRRVLDGS